MFRIMNLHCAPIGDSPLRGVTLHVSPGELVVVTGANGAGKGTLCRCIARIYRTGEGRIDVDDMPLPSRPHLLIATGVAVLLRGQRVFPEMTVMENLCAVPSRQNREARRGALEEVFDLFPLLRDRRTQVSGTLSGGEQQMVAIGRALVAAPRVFVLEEPSLGLSPRLASTVYRALDAVRRTGRAVLVTEEDLRMVGPVGQRAYLLHRGLVVAEGSADRVSAELATRSFGPAHVSSSQADARVIGNLVGDHGSRCTQRT